MKAFHKAFQDLLLSSSVLPQREESTLQHFLVHQHSRLGALCLIFEDAETGPVSLRRLGKN